MQASYNTDLSVPRDLAMQAAAAADQHHTGVETADADVVCQTPVKQSIKINFIAKETDNRTTDNTEAVF